MKRTRTFYFLALATAGTGISGGDRIFIELARRWGRKYPLKIFTSFEGLRLCRKQALDAKYLDVLAIKNKFFERAFLLNYVYKIVAGVKLGFTLKLDEAAENFVYSASEFLMDLLLAFILKMRYPKAKWVAAWYQTAPNPVSGFTEGERRSRYRLNSLLYWLSQRLAKPLVLRFADFVLVNNEEEKRQFPRLDKSGRAIVVLGAVDLERVRSWRRKLGNLPKVYDAVFQGRFHPQKGVVELIDIWKKVVEKKPDAKLAMIGDGPLMGRVKKRVKDLKLEKNIKLFGYVFDGLKKYRTFSQSRVVVHPAFYDSGGMAAAEAMAFGLPGVGFDLKSYKFYYPKGMVKVDTGDLNAFAEAVTVFLRDEEMRKRVGNIALEMVRSSWSWDERAFGVLSKIIAK